MNLVHQVQWSDIDQYNHTNYTSYSKFAVDSMQAALHKQEKDGRVEGLKDLTFDFVDNGLKQLNICYLQQSLMGDTLDVHVWQEEGDSHTIICSMHLGESHICQVFLEYFDSDNSHSS